LQAETPTGVVLMREGKGEGGLEEQKGEGANKSLSPGGEWKINSLIITIRSTEGDRRGGKKKSTRGGIRSYGGLDNPLRGAKSKSDFFLLGRKRIIRGKRSCL